MKKFLVLTAGMLATGTAAAIDDLHFYLGADQAELDVVTFVNLGMMGIPPRRSSSASRPSHP